VPPVSTTTAGTSVPGVRVHYCGWAIHDDETIPTHSLSARIRPRRNSTLYGPLGPESEAEVRDLYNSRKPLPAAPALPLSGPAAPGALHATQNAMGEQSTASPITMPQVCWRWHVCVRGSFNETACRRINLESRLI
jgi:hypothetical protein